MAAEEGIPERLCNVNMQGSIQRDFKELGDAAKQ
jgi:hypothetical protein